MLQKTKRKNFMVVGGVLYVRKGSKTILFSLWVFFNPTNGKPTKTQYWYFVDFSLNALLKCVLCNSLKAISYWLIYFY